MLTRRRILLVVLYLLTVTLCFLLGHWDRIGADCYYFERLIAEPTIRCFYRSCLTVFIHQAVYRILRPLDVIPWYAIAISSSLAGAGYLFVLWRFSTSPLFWVLNVSAGCVWVFFGHVENYAWVNFFLILSLYELREYHRGRQPLCRASAAYFAAVASHLLAVFYLPGYLYYLRGRSLDDRDRIGISLPLIVTSLFLVVTPLVLRTEGIDVGFDRLVPWISLWAKNHYFLIFSVDHLRMLAFFHGIAAPFGVPFLSLLLILLYSWHLRDRYLGALAVMVGCGVLWMTFWHPDWGYRDWDLFSQFGLIANLLAGLVLTRKGEEN